MKKQKGVTTLVGIIIIIVVAVILFGGVFAYQYFATKFQQNQIQNKNSNPESCLDTAVSQLDLNICANNLYLSANEKLNNLYKKIIDKLNVDASNQLDVAEQSWIKTRDETCKVISIMDDGGSIAPMNLGLCLESSTNYRIKELNDSFQWLLEGR